MAKYIVGLTGGIGSGKTTVSNMFLELGINIIDADVVAREVVQPNSPALNKIAQHFGQDILLADGQLNRSLLRSKIFANSDEKSWLNDLLHPLIRTNIITQLEQASGKYCILSAPLLFENQLHKMVQRSLVIDVSKQIQIARTCQRDNTNEAEVCAIINSQISREKRLALADDVLNNESNDLSEVKQRVLILDKSYRQLASSQLDNCE